MRETKADERERIADEREAEADERERVADERERVADEREAEADQREERLKELVRELRALVTGARRSTLQTIEDSRTVAAAQEERRLRNEEALERLAAASERQQAALQRAIAEGERESASKPTGPGGRRGQFETMRELVTANAIAFASIEEDAARIYDEIAAHHYDPAHARKCRQTAEEARSAASRARELVRNLGA